MLAISAAPLLLFAPSCIGLQAYVLDVTVIDQEMVTAALWIKDNIPPDDLLVTHDIGAVGYFAPRPILDIAGLVSPEVVPLMRNPDALWALMQERGAQYLEVARTTRFPATPARSAPVPGVHHARRRRRCGRAAAI